MCRIQASEAAKSTSSRHVPIESGKEGELLVRSAKREWLYINIIIAFSFGA
jgi:hypothetical protein